MTHPRSYAVRRLAEHAFAVGAQEAALTDPNAQFQLELLRQFITVTEAALADEGAGPVVAERVLDRVIYGCLPQPAVYAERQRLIRKVTEAAALRTVRLIVEEQV